MIETLIPSDPYVCLSGILYTLDMAQITQSHTEQYTDLILKRLAVVYEKCLPILTKAFCFINVPSGTDQISLAFTFHDSGVYPLDYGGEKLLFRKTCRWLFKSS